METTQKKTYLVYSRGMMPDDLTLGSLYLDPCNPLHDERKRFECPLSPYEIEAWTAAPELDQPCQFSFTASRQWQVNSGLWRMLKGRAGAGGIESVTVSSKAGRRRRIRQPEKFLNHVLLSSQAAREWLADRLSVSRAMYFRSRVGLSKPPGIWIVTGIQYLSNVQVVSNRTERKVAGGSVNLPLPGPVSAAITLVGEQEGISSAFKVDSSSGSSHSFHHADERVWAVQFRQLAVKFVQRQPGEQDVPSLIQLRDVVDLKEGAVRSDLRLLDDVQLSMEVAEICGVEEVDSERSDGESLLDQMQDVDWSTLNMLLKSVNYKSDILHE